MQISVYRSVATNRVGQAVYAVPVVSDAPIAASTTTRAGLVVSSTAPSAVVAESIVIPDGSTKVDGRWVFPSGENFGLMELIELAARSAEAGAIVGPAGFVPQDPDGTGVG